MKRIGRALLSVYDKSGILDFARGLSEFGVEILSSGGTALTLREGGIKVRDLEEITGFKELFGGRVKTLHPSIHGAILARRDNEEHEREAKEKRIDFIDMVVVNLYPFSEVIQNNQSSLEEAIENIDIGGPALLRSAAKNYQDVVCISDPSLYSRILKEMKDNSGCISLKTKAELAVLAFEQISKYDNAIAKYLKEVNDVSLNGSVGREDILPENIEFVLEKVLNLRYGENPHQRGAFYRVKDEKAEISYDYKLSGKDLSYCNILDSEAAWNLVSEFEEVCCVIVKHTNPCGCGIGKTTREAFVKAYNGDPVSSFGGIVSFNQEIDEDCARVIVEPGENNPKFFEVILAPSFSESALKIIQNRSGWGKNVRLISLKPLKNDKSLEFRSVYGGILAQERNSIKLISSGLRVVTERTPSEEEIENLIFAFIVVKHVKSNGVVIANGKQVLGVGAGQMNRVASVRIALSNAGLKSKGAVLASDGFFPFSDGPMEAGKAGISAIIQPGGSVRDREVIEEANRWNMSMVFTGIRGFKH